MRDFDVERRLNFTNDIEPVLTKFGCNAGGCHGKASGQNGFKLSLLGFDPAGDYDAARQRRPGTPDFSSRAGTIAFADEADGAVSPRRRAEVRPPVARLFLIIALAEPGAPFGKSDDPTVVGIAVAPPAPTMERGSRQQIRVVARLSDGTTKDVTRAAEYKSQQPDILNVDRRRD